MEQVLVALISAVASIIAACISAGIFRRTDNATSVPSSPYITSPLSRMASTAWWIATALIGAWVVLTPLLVYPDINAFNLLVVLVATIVLAWIWPTKPAVGAAFGLALQSLNLFMGPISMKLRHDPRLGNLHYGGVADKPTALIFFAVLIAVNALLVVVICRWRQASKNSQHAVSLGGFGASASKPPKVGVRDLDRLVTLHETGKLTNEEFRDAKKRLLSE